MLDRRKGERGSVTVLPTTKNRDLRANDEMVKMDCVGKKNREMNLDVRIIDFVTSTLMMVRPLLYLRTVFMTLVYLVR